MENELLPQNPLESITLNASLGDVALFFFYIVLAMYVVFTIIFLYHWRQYSSNTGITTLTFVAFAITTLPVIATMAALVFFI